MQPLFARSLTVIKIGQVLGSIIINISKYEISLS